MIKHHGEWTLSNFHCHPFSLDGRGSFIHLHSHNEDHLVQSNKEIAVYVMGKDGVERIERLRGSMGGVVAFETIIAAHVEHLIIALEKGTTYCQCLFSRYDANGLYLHDPKECSSSPKVGSCDPYLLPEIVKKLLNAQT